MGKGGARPGSGRKPGSKNGIVLAHVSRAAMALPPALSVEEASSLLVAPSDLPAGAQACWTAHAAHALAERTLTPATAGGFRQFCEQWAFLADLSSRIQVLGAATKEADPYLKMYVRLSQRVDASLARFKLTAFGKPAVSEKPKPAANPWGAFGNSQAK
jgi:hypothetical protein